MSQKYDSLGNKINIQVDYNAGVSTGGNTAGTTGMATRQIVLVGLGALSLSQSLGAGYGTISFSVPNQSAQSLGFYGSSQTTGQSSSSSFDARSITLVGQGIVSVGMSAGSILISATEVAQTVQTIGIYASSQTTGQSSSSTIDARSLSVVGMGNISVGLSAGSLLISGAGGGGGGTLTLFASSNTTGQSSSTTVNVTSVMFRGMGIASVGYSIGEIIISVPSGGGAGDGGNVLAAGTRTATTLGTVLFSNANNFTWGLDAVNGSIMTASFSESVQTIGLYASSQTTGQSSSSTVDARSITLVGRGIVSVGMSGGSFLISATEVAQSVQSIGLYASSQTTGQSSSSTVDARSITIVGQGNISVGLSNGSFIISQTGGGGMAISAAGASASAGTIVFSNLNNVSFGMAGSTVTATITVPAQTVQSIGLYASSQTTGQSSSSTVDARSVTFVGQGIVSVGLSGGSYLISASSLQSVQSIGLYASSQTTGQSSSSTVDARSISFVGRGIVSVGLSGGSYLISATEVAQTVQTIGLYASSQTTGQSSSSTVDARSITFVGAGNISVGLSGGSYLISATTAAQTVQTIGLYASSQTTGQSSSSTVDARSISFVGQGIVSVGLSGGSYLISATTAQSVQSIGLYASSQTTGQSSSSTVDARSITFVGQGIVSVGLSGGSYLVSATQSVQSIGVYASSQTTGQSSSSTIDARSMSIVGMGIASVGMSGGSILISVPAGGGAGDGANFLAAGTRTATTLGTVLFSNANGVSFGLNAVNGSIMTASIDIGLGISTEGNTAGTTGFVGSRMLFVGSGPISLSQSVNGQSATISVIGPATSSLAAAGGILISTAGSTITISCANSYLARSYQPWPVHNTGTAVLSLATVSSGSASFMQIPVHVSVQAGWINIIVSMSYLTAGTSTGVNSQVFQYGLYSRGTGANSSTLSQMTSGSFALYASFSNSSQSLSWPNSTNTAGFSTTSNASGGFSNSSSFTGLKLIALPLVSTVTPGIYWLGIFNRMSTTNVAAAGMRMSLYGNAMSLSSLAPIGDLPTNYSTGTPGVGGASTIPLGGNFLIGNGVFSSAAQTNLPSTVALSAITNNISFQPYVNLLSTQ